MSDDLAGSRGKASIDIVAASSDPANNLPALSDISERDKVWDQHRSESDVIASYYQDSEFAKYADRMFSCANFLDFVLTPDKVEGDLRLKLANTWFCRVRTCMVCSWRKSLRWKAKAYQGLPKFLLDFPGNRFLFLTLTVKNCPVTNLRKTLESMNTAFTRMTRLKAFPGVGWIKSVEVTRGRRGDAHPHFHVLLVVPGSYFGRRYLSQNSWCDLWQKSLRVDYKPILDVQALKAEDSLLGLIAEVIKYQTKPSHFFQDREWFLEYTRQIYRTKQITVGGVLRKYLKQLEQDPDDLIGEDPDGCEVNEGHLYAAYLRKFSKYYITGSSA